MKIAGGILSFLLIVGVGFVIVMLVKGKANANTTASGGNWFSKPAQSSTWGGSAVGADPTAQERADIAAHPQSRTGRGAF